MFPHFVFLCFFTLFKLVDSPWCSQCQLALTMLLLTHLVWESACCIGRFPNTLGMHLDAGSFGHPLCGSGCFGKVPFCFCQNVFFAVPIVAIPFSCDGFAGIA